MSWLAVCVALGLAEPTPPAPPWIAGRVFTSEDVHVGARPAADLEIMRAPSGPPQVWWAVGATVQITVRTPF